MAEYPKDIKGSVELTAADVLQRLRDAAHPPGKKGLWLRHLNDKQLAEIYHRLRLGQTNYKICQMVQKAWRVMPESDIKSLTRGLKRFRESVIGLLQQAEKSPDNMEERKQEAELKKKGDRIVKSLDAMGRLGWLIEMQSERIDMYKEREASLKLPLKQTIVEMQALANMLDKYISHAIRLGLMNEKPSEFNVNLKGEFAHFTGQLTDGGTKVVQAAHKFMELAKANAIRMRLNPETGRYEPVETGQLPPAPDLCDLVAGKEVKDAES